MSRVRCVGVWAAVFVFWAATAGDALAQHGPAGVPSAPVIVGPPPGSMPQIDPDYFQRNQAAMEKNLLPAGSNPAGDMEKQITGWWPSPENLMLGLEIVLGLVAFIVVVWVGARVYANLRQSNDPMKYVMSDPWVRDQLARQGVPPDQGPPA